MFVRLNFILMRLGKGEKVLKVYYHHYLPFVRRLIKVFLITLPFYFMLFLFKDGLPNNIIFGFHLVLISVFSLITVYITLVYWLDRLVITNKRVVFIDWKYLTVKAEHETELADIQEVSSYEKGIIAILPVFDYGSIVIQTASSSPTIEFPEAPDPDSIKTFIYSLIHDR